VSQFNLVNPIDPSRLAIRQPELPNNMLQPYAVSLDTPAPISPSNQADRRFQLDCRSFDFVVVGRVEVELE